MFYPLVVIIVNRNKEKSLLACEKTQYSRKCVCERFSILLKGSKKMLIVVSHMAGNIECKKNCFQVGGGKFLQSNEK